jgi:hypothetical protein
LLFPLVFLEFTRFRNTWLYHAIDALTGARHGQTTTHFLKLLSQNIATLKK